MIQSVQKFLLLLAVSLGGAPDCFAEATIEEVFAAHRENCDRLEVLHVQYLHQQEWTDAYRESHRKKAEAFEKFIKSVNAGEESEQGRQLLSQISLEQLQEQAETARGFAANREITRPVEIYIDGQDHQVRTPALWRQEDIKEYTFPLALVKPGSLVKDYAHTRIYSRSTQLQPPARIWPGQSRPDSETYAMITAKQVSETASLRLPPLTQSLKPRWDHRHPIDTFMGHPIEHYRVVGEEEQDGRLLTIVDASLPTGQHYTIATNEGKNEQHETRHYYLAWLDLQQGAIPVLLHMWQQWPEATLDAITQQEPQRISATKEVRELTNGGFYPTVTVEEQFNVDPQAPQLTTEEWAEVRAGKRTVSNVVYERQTWTCTSVECEFVHDGDFFVLRFPASQAMYDLDAEQTIGALEPQPVVKAGEAAPSLSVSRWLDGQSHSLEDLRGRVVVIDFWGLWCGACRSSIPALKQLQAKYANQPVTFLSIHTAGNDPVSLADRIQQYANKEDWQFLAGIDEGTMIENSVTANYYGVHGFPTHVIIDHEGIVTYNSGEPPEGLEEIMGKPRDEATAEDTQRIEAYQQKRIEAAGGSWPLAEGITEKEMIEVLTRVNVWHLSQEIDRALELVEDRAE